MEKLEIKQNWDFYMCNIEDKPSSIRLNLALYDIAPIKDYNYRMTILVKMKKPDENGLSSNEEYPILCDIEDAVTEKAEKLDGIFTATIKSNGILEIYIFTKNPNEMENACKETLATFQDYEWKCFFDEDPEWDIYFNFLYPDEYSFQAMMNRRVIQNLMEQGDNSEAEREVDHWLYFSNSKDRDFFVNKAEGMGYKINSLEELEERNYPYQVHISRLDKAEYHHINNIVWELLDIIRSLNGYYDGWGCPIVK